MPPVSLAMNPKHSQLPPFPPPLALPPPPESHFVMSHGEWNIDIVLTSHSRPGILVLINDADWELEGEEAYEIRSGDEILFVSTLHGG